MPSTNEMMTIVLAVLASLPGLLALRSQFAKDKIADRDSKTADETARIKNTQMIMDQAMGLIDPLKEQIDILEKTVHRQGEQIAFQEKQICTLKTGVAKLTKQIKGLDLEPVWTPPDNE